MGRGKWWQKLVARERTSDDRVGYDLFVVKGCEVEEYDYGRTVQLRLLGPLSITVNVPRKAWDNVVAPAIARYEARKKLAAGEG